MFKHYMTYQQKDAQYTTKLLCTNKGTFTFIKLAAFSDNFKDYVSSTPFYKYILAAEAHFNKLV